MKNYIFLLTFLFSTYCSYSQIAFYDAQTLKTTGHVGTAMLRGTNIIQLPSTPPVLAILKKYVPASDSSNTDSIINRFIGNPYIQFDTASRRHTNNLLSFTSNIPGAISGTDVTSVVDGFATFLAQRAKQELNIVFFQNLNIFLNEHPEIKQLFPNTEALLGNFYSYETANMLSLLQVAFDSDMKAMLGNIAKVADLPDTVCYCNSKQSRITNCKNRLDRIRSFFNTEYGRTVMAALVIGDGTINKSNPADILSSLVGNNTLAGMENGNKANVDIINSLKLLNVISASLRSTTQGEIWVSVDQIKSLTTDSTAMNIYMGLLYQQMLAQNITIDGKKVWKELSSFTNRVQIDKFGDYVVGFGSAFDGVIKAFDTVKSHKNKDTTAYFNYF